MWMIWSGVRLAVHQHQFGNNHRRSCGGVKDDTGNQIHCKGASAW